MFRKKPAAPLTLPQKTCLYQQQLQEALRTQDAAARDAKLTHLLDAIDKDLPRRTKDFHDNEERRMIRGLLGVSAGIPLAAGAAALAGAPLALLVLVPAVMGTGIYTRHKNHQAHMVFKAENEAYLPVIAHIRRRAIDAQERARSQNRQDSAAPPPASPQIKNTFSGAAATPPQRAKTDPQKETGKPQPARRKFFRPPFGS